MARTPRRIGEFTGRAPGRQIAAPNFGDVSGSLDSIGRSLGGIEDQINKRLDEQAIKEGKAAGLAAGQRDELILMADDTLRGQAFNSVATQTFRGRIEIKIRGEMNAAFTANKDNPSALQQAFEDIRKANLKGVPAQVIPDVNNLIDKQALVGLEASGRIHEKNVLSANRATAADQLTAQMRGLEQTAFTIADPERGSNMVLDGVNEFRETLISFGPRGEFEFNGEVFQADINRSGVFAPADMQRFMRQVQDNVVSNKALGKFDRAQGIAAKVVVRDSIRPAWERGEIDLSEAQVTSLENRMDGDIRSARVEQNAGTRALTNKVRSINSLVEKGFDIKPDDWNAIQAEVTANGDPALAETLDAAKALSLWQNQIVQMDPATLQSVVNEQRDQIRTGGGIENLEQIRRLEVSENLLTEMKRELGRDPISWGVRVGLIDNEPIVLSGDQAADSMDRRRAQGNAVAERYGITPKFLTDEEASSLGTTLPTMTTDEKILLANTISVGFQEDASQILNRISDDNRGFAHVGGLVHGGSQGNTDVAKNILDGNLARIEQKIAILPPRSDLDTGFINLTGTALGGAPEMRVNVTEAAKDIYTIKGLRIGLTADDFDDDLWERSLNEAVGAVFVDGIQFGGFGDFNGAKIVLPRGMTQDDFDQRIAGLNDEKLSAGILGDIPRHADGTIVTADEFEDGFLISVGDGLYGIALNEDGTDILLGDNPGRAFTFDINELQIPDPGEPLDLSKVGQAGFGIGDLSNIQGQ